MSSALSDANVSSITPPFFAIASACAFTSHARIRPVARGSSSTFARIACAIEPPIIPNPTMPNVISLSSIIFSFLASPTSPLPTSYFLLPTSYFLLHTSYFILHTSYFILHTSYFILHTSYFILLSQCAILHRRILSKHFHKIVELRRRKRLLTVTQCLLRIVVHFDDKAVRSHRNRRFCKCRHHPAQTACMAWVDDDRKMRFLLQERHHADVKAVARVVVERTNAAFAQDDVFVSARHDVFCRHKQFLHRSCKSTL